MKKGINYIWHTTATIIVQSLITGLFEVGSQMVISIDVSHDWIIKYYVTFYENSKHCCMWHVIAMIVMQMQILGLLEVANQIMISIMCHMPGLHNIM